MQCRIFENVGVFQTLVNKLNCQKAIVKTSIQKTLLLLGIRHSKPGLGNKAPTVFPQLVAGLLFFFLRLGVGYYSRSAII